MLQLSLSQLFGAGASQSATAITISKADLAAVGLSVSANNRSEALLCALALVALRNWEGKLTVPDGQAVTDPGGNPITYKQSADLYEKLRLLQWQRRFVAGRQRDTIVCEVFVTPPTEFGTPLTANIVNYGD